MPYASPRKAPTLVLIDICESLPEVEYPLATRDDLDETASLVRELGRQALTYVVDVRDGAALSAVVAEEWPCSAVWRPRLPTPGC